MIIRSIVIDHLKSYSREQQVSIGYIYCDYKDRRNQSTVNLISSLVKQLAMQQDNMPSQVREAYSKHGNGESSLSIDKHSELLESLLRLSKKSYIIIDALDEHLNGDEKHPTVQIEFLRRVQEIQKQANASSCCRLFLTSRENRLIEDQLEGCTRVEIRATDSDIRQFLRARISDCSTFHLAGKLQTEDSLVTEIIGIVVEKAHGMSVATYCIEI
jgi:hypothetical protein